MRRAAGVVFAALTAVIASAHVGSPNVFFAGKAGPYDVRVVVRPPEVVPGVARVTVRSSAADVSGVGIRPVYWRAGSRGAPSADETRRLEGESGTWEGSLWLMAHGAYTVDVIVTGSRGTANVLVPVASVATGRLSMSPGLGAILVALGFILCAGLVNIVYKAAGESLVAARETMGSERRRRARRVAAIAVPIVALIVLGGARWWGAVDRDYERSMYKPGPLNVALDAGKLTLSMTDTVWQMRAPSPLLPDHGKLMHMFLVRDDTRAFAHLHPVPADTGFVPPMRTTLPPLPPGSYHVFADVVHEMGFERTLVGRLEIDSATVTSPTPADPDDAWFVGEPTRDSVAVLADGSTMSLELVPNGVVPVGREETIRIHVRDPNGSPAALEPYLGMAGHGVVMLQDGSVYVHLHPMGTITMAARDAFEIRDRGDTTSSGRLVNAHAGHDMSSASSVTSRVEFPYAFPKSGSYRLYVQVKRGGRILTGAFIVPVAEVDRLDR